MNSRFVNLRLFVVLTIFTGVIYPFLIIFLGQIFSPFKSNGSFLRLNDKIVGSELIGQSFTDPKYFHCRPSAVNYDAGSSGAINYAPSNANFHEEVKNRIDQIRSENGISKDQSLPADSVLSLASGLDPHISVENAFLQIPRISKTRMISQEKLVKIVQEHIEPPLLGFLGDNKVNVLKLNIALDQLKS